LIDGNSDFNITVTDYVSKSVTLSISSLNIKTVSQTVFSTSPYDNQSGFSISCEILFYPRFFSNHRRRKKKEVED